MMTLRSLCLAAVALAATAVPAFAGLEFTNVAVVGPASASAARFNGATQNAFNTAGGQALPQQFSAVGTNLLTIGVNPADPSIAGLPPGLILPLSVNLDFKYTGNPFFVVNYGPTVGFLPSYNMVIQFGTILTPVNTSIVLNSISFEQNNSGVFATSGISVDSGATFSSLFIFPSMSDSKLFITIDPAVVPVGLRGAVTTVRLNFTMGMISGSGVTPQFAINAVVNPEPGTVALFGLGLVGLAGAVRARRKKRAVDAPTA